MRDIEEIKSILKTARDCGCPDVIIDGVKYSIASPEEVKAAAEVPDMKPEDIIKPMSVLDELTNEEILYYATPYFDDLQEQRRLHQEAINNGANNG